jgi:rhamnosyltransferase
VIIPTYNAGAYLLALLEKLKIQTVDFELIIIDSSSTDDTLQIAKQYTQNIISIDTRCFDHGGTRTQALKHATGDIIVFLTQDALPYDSTAIEVLVKVFSASSIAAAYGRQVPYEKTSFFGKHLRLFNYTKKSYLRTLADKDSFGIKTAFLSDSFAAYRKSALEEIDYFKNGLIVGEDTYAGSKLILAGYTLAYVADAKVYHSHSYTCIEEFRRYFDIGVFHHDEAWILEAFGKPEGEGGRYVKSEFNYLLTHHAYHRIPEFFIRNGLKYLGYKLGQRYTILPKFLAPKLSMHSLWWNKSTSV